MKKAQENTINFKISDDLYANLHKYSLYLNLNIQTVMRYILFEQIQNYIFNKDSFETEYKQRRYREAQEKETSYGPKQPKKYTQYKIYWA